MVFMVGDPPPAPEPADELPRFPVWEVLVGLAIWAAVGLVVWWNWR